MDIEPVVKLVAVLASALGVWKLLVELARSRRTVIRDEYRFAKEFLNDLRQSQTMHPYLKDKGYEALVGGGTLSSREVEYVLSQSNPSQLLRDYSAGRKYIEHVATAGDRPIMLRQSYRKPRMLRNLAYRYIGIFVFSYTMAWLPVIVPSLPRSLEIRVSTAFGLTIAIFVPLGYWAFRQAMQVASARAALRSSGGSGIDA